MSIKSCMYKCQDFMLCFEFYFKFNQPVITTLQYANSQTVSSYDIIFYLA